MQYFSVCAIRLFSKPSSHCVKSIPSMWRICAPLGIVVQTHAAVYDALGCQKSFLPLSYLLNQSPPRPLLSPVCLRSRTLISRFQFRRGFVASTMKRPESFPTSVGNCSYYCRPLCVQPRSNKSFSSLTYFLLLPLLLRILKATNERGDDSPRLLPFVWKVLVKVFLFISRH